MTTISLKINEKTKKGQAFIEFLKQYVINDETVELVKTPNAETIKAIEEVYSGKVIKAKNATELIKKLNS
jgi:antitoxin component of RelBE/YafQ-DinJ toxin-antitoxin module